MTETKTLASQLIEELMQRRCRGRIVSAKHISELKREIKNRLKEGAFDKEFYKLRLSFFDFNYPIALKKANSIIVVAVPRPQAQAAFTFKGNRITLIIPPTYVGYKRTNDLVGEFLTELLAKEDFKVAKTLLPLKLLAVRSGLARYGRNNITYVDGMGSFHELVAYYSDLPCESDSWQEIQLMQSCESCQACSHSCPTGAIAEDRFLLHADRCITYHNEMKGNISFPNWLDPSWHNALYGCMRCQTVCPQDRPFLKWIGEHEEFSEKETELLLSKIEPKNLPYETLAKLKRLDMADADSLDNLPRNLKVFL